MSLLSTVSVSLTNRCNLNCSHCGNTGYSGYRSSADEMTRGELRRLFKTFAKERVGLVGISGGEPLLRDDFTEIMQDCSEYGLPVMLLTNGLLLDRRIVRHLAGLETVETVRLSVEFPTEHIPENSGSFHPVKSTFDAIRRCADAGITTGVNMTLLPGNKQWAQELADRSRNAGASFFRAVPVFPIGNFREGVLSGTFINECIETVLQLHACFGRVDRVKESRIPQRQLVRGFAHECSAGTHLLSIDADGTVSGCPLVSTSAKKIRWDDHTFSEITRRLRRRTRDLQRKIIGNPAGHCSSCKVKEHCKGGCPAEWDSRMRPAGQPVCYMNAVREIAADNSRDPALVRVLHSLVERMDTATMFGVRQPCLRAIPLWTVWFDGN